MFPVETLCSEINVSFQHRRAKEFAPQTIISGQQCRPGGGSSGGKL